MDRHLASIVASFLLLTSCFVVVVTSTQQPDLYFASGQGMFSTGSILIDESSRTMFVADGGNNRILIWRNIDSLTNNSLPDAVLGQPNLIEVDNGCSATHLYDPESGMVMDSQGTLWVCDSSNHRVLWFHDAANLPSGSPADGVIGQPNLTTCDQGGGRTGFDYPTDVTLYGNSIFVADYNNNRVLRFDGATLPSFPTAGASADGVIGPADFNDNSNNLLSATYSVAATDDGLYVDSYDTSVVYYYTWAEANKTKGASPAFSYGTADSPGTTRNLMGSPAYMSFDPSGKYLFLADYGSYRALLFAAPPTQDGPPALDVFGASDFDTYGPDFRTWGVGYDSVANNLWAIEYNSGLILRYPNALGGSFDSSNVDVDIRFQPRIPQLTLYPKQDGGIQTQVYVTVQPISIEEVTSGGTVVKEVTLPDYGWDIQSSKDDSSNTQQASFFSLVKVSNESDSSDAEITITFSLFESEQNLNSAGVSFTVEGSAMKFDIELKKWNFTSSSNSLRLHVPVVVSPPSSSFTQSTSGGITSYSFGESGSGLSAILNAISSAVVDGTNTPITFSFDSKGTNNNNEETFDLVLDVPHFSSSFAYDPDIVVKLPSSRSAASTLRPFYLSFLN